MPDLEDVLLELRYAGVEQVPQDGDAGDQRVRRALEREITDPPRRFRLTRRTAAVGGFGITPAALIAVVATAAAATGGAVFAVNAATRSNKRPTSITKPTSSPRTIFLRDPYGPFGTNLGRVPPTVHVAKTTVILATVHDRANATIPHYGKVQFWSAKTKQGGFCFAVKLPNGSWAGYPFSQHPTNGFYGGSLPGCIDTEQQRSIGEDGAPSAEAPTTLEGFNNEVKTRTGQIWELFFGYVTTQGQAATVKDPVTGHTATVTHDGYFLLAEPESSVNNTPILQVLDADGRPLEPDYTRSGLLPGYKMGPTSGPRP